MGNFIDMLEFHSYWSIEKSKFPHLRLMTRTAYSFSILRYDYYQRAASGYDHVR